MARPQILEAQNGASSFQPAPAWGPGEPALDSPARRLQQELERALSGAGEPRWSARRALGFMVLTSGAFWLAVIWGLKAALS